MRMRIGTATVVVALGLALAGCGGAPTDRAVHDSVVPATTSDESGSLGPGSNPSIVIADNDVPEDDDVIVRPPVQEPTCPEGPMVHFDTPQAAMTYLADAWNRNDLAALCQVTNPNARFELNDMHREAVNLRLKKCEQFKVGYYNCTFIHDYPARMHKSGTGRAWLVAAAADNPGWYMTIYEGCG